MWSNCPQIRIFDSIPVKIQLPTIRYKQLNDSLQNIFDSSFLEWSTNNFKQLPEYLESKMTLWMKKVPILSRIFGNVSFRMIDGKQGKYSLGKILNNTLFLKIIETAKIFVFGHLKQS